MTEIKEMSEAGLNQNQFDSLVSLCFNIGVDGFKNSTLVKKINAGAANSVIEAAFMMWRKPVEIIGRRKREVKLYFTA